MIMCDSPYMSANITARQMNQLPELSTPSDSISVNCNRPMKKGTTESLIPGTQLKRITVVA